MNDICFITGDSSSRGIISHRKDLVDDPFTNKDITVLSFRSVDDQLIHIQSFVSSEEGIVVCDIKRVSEPERNNL